MSAASPSLHRKLVVLVLTAVGAAVAVSTAMAAWQQAFNYGAMRKQSLMATAQVFAAAVGPATAEGRRDDVFLALRAIGRVPDISYAEVRGPDGRLLAALGNVSRLLEDPSLDGKDSVSVLDLLTSRTVLVGTAIVNGGTTVGNLILVGGTADLWRQLLSTVVLTMLGGALALVVGFAVAWRFQRAITKPLRSLLGAMGRIREEHRYDVTVANAADREIGELVAGFNRMLHDVRERDERLAAHRRNLEQEVADRTVDLREARDAAETANRAKSEFLATMSHEIRTPMNGIMVMAELLTAGTLPARQRRFAEIIAKSGQSLLAIINDILDFSKIEAGRIDLEQAPVDLNEIAENVVSLFAERARSKSIDLAAVVDPAMPRSITGDPVRLSQIVANLVNNALKFTERGFVKLTIGRAPGDPRSIEISVSDSGIGIPPEKLPTIFEAFSQADQSTTRRFGGTGLGLTICKRLVAAMGGSIRVESTPGVGSAFTVVLPVGEPGRTRWPRLELAPGGIKFCMIDVAGEATAASIARYVTASGYQLVSRGEHPAAEQYSGASLVIADAERLPSLTSVPDGLRPILVGVCALGDGACEALARNQKADALIARPVLRSEIEHLLEHVAAGEPLPSATDVDLEDHDRPARFTPFTALVADDNPVNREVACEALGQIGASVETVENGIEAVAAVASHRYDIVFMDGSMPELDGFEATRRIRAAESRDGKSRTPIVALTAHVVGTAADAWRDAGMDDVVHKPFTVKKLAQTIGRLLPHLPTEDKAADGRPATDMAVASPAAAAGAFPDEHDELIDLGVLAQLQQMQSAGKGDFVQKVFKLYVEHAPPAVKRIEEAAHARNADDCAKVAHALKSMSYNIGAKQVARLALDIETAGKTESRLPDTQAIEWLRQALTATLEALAGTQGLGSSVEATPIAQRDSEIERLLPLALERDELFVLYQPIVDRSGTRTCCVEALIRWKPADRDPVPPSVFIPFAEKTGLIHAIGDWVLRRACRDAAAWPDLTLAVNVSPIQFQRPDLADRVSRIIAEAGFDARRLELEITESALLSAERSVLQVMERLNAAGMTFALDDFGTGYSSLNYLRRFPFGKIKIDRSFVTNLNTVDATIVHAVASIGRSLGLKLVAEGVEEGEQQRFLSSAGIHFMQGYLFGKPMTAQEIFKRLTLERAAGDGHAAFDADPIRSVPAA